MFFFYLHSQGFVTLDSCEAAEKAVDEVCRGEKSTLLSLVTLPFQSQDLISSSLYCLPIMLVRTIWYWISY